MRPLRTLVGKAGNIWARGRVTRPQAQRFAVLEKLLRIAKDTRYGKAHDFEGVLAANNLYDAFRTRIPIIDYSDWVSWLGAKSPLEGPQALIDEAWPGKIDTYCLSSGTTSGRTKYIPYSKRMAAVNREAALMLFAYSLTQKPELTPPLSKTLYMSGSTKIERDENGVLAGDMSALTKYLSPRILEAITLPPRAISDLEPWSVRLEQLVRLCLRDTSVGVLSGIPIWQLTFLEALREAGGKPIAEIMPRLRLIIHGGMSLNPYRARLRELVGDQVLFQEVYAASETGITAFTVPGEDGMRFWEGYDVFYELEHPDGEVIHPGEAQTGIAYALLVSSCSGLWRYRIGDRVVFNKTDPLTIAYVTRDKTTSAFDEKVTEKELELAMAGMESAFSDFSLGSDVPNRRHVWFLVGQDAPGDGWMEQLDQRLRSGNEDYDDYRGDGRINPPTFQMVNNRGAYLTQLGREEGGQRKFPRILSVEETAQLLERS